MHLSAVLESRGSIVVRSSVVRNRRLFSTEMEVGRRSMWVRLRHDVIGSIVDGSDERVAGFLGIKSAGRETSRPRTWNRFWS
jgi:hypothetical protein